MVLFRLAALPLLVLCVGPPVWALCKRWHCATRARRGWLGAWLGGGIGLAAVAVPAMLSAPLKFTNVDPWKTPEQGAAYVFFGLMLVGLVAVVAGVAAIVGASIGGLIGWLVAGRSAPAPPGSAGQQLPSDPRRGGYGQPLGPAHPPRPRRSGPLRGGRGGR